MKTIIKIAALVLLFLSSGCASNDDSSTIFTVFDFSVTMDENPGNGRTIGTISTSPSTGLSFSISNQSPNGAMSINSASGELSVANATLFDFETNPEITGTVMVSNGDLSKSASIAISLIDKSELNIVNGDVILPYQRDIDNFGLQNYDVITGTLQIGFIYGPNDIVDLSPLSSLTSVGSLIVYSTQYLVNLDGLHNLNSSVERLQFLRNSALSNIEALSGISNIEVLQVQYCNSLLNLGGLETAISPAFLDIVINFNGNLTNIDALQSLTTIPASNGSIYISYNDALLNINGLGNITNLQELEIENNPSLENINGLESLTGIRLNFIILNNDLIENLDGLSQLNTVSGFLNISENNALTNINGLTNLSSSVRTIYIKNNSSLTNLNGLNSLTHISNLLSIHRNMVLTDLTGLNNLIDFNRIYVGYNDSLTNLNGFENISERINGFEITNNPLLSDFCGFNNYFTNPNSWIPSVNFDVYGNLYNPTSSDLQNGDCSL